MIISDLDTTDVGVQRARLLVTTKEPDGSIGRSTIYEPIRDGELETIHIGRSCHIAVDSLDASVGCLRARPRVDNRLSVTADLPGQGGTARPG